jgi:hypothetical protein
MNWKVCRRKFCGSIWGTIAAFAWRNRRKEEEPRSYCSVLRPNPSRAPSKKIRKVIARANLPIQSYVLLKTLLDKRLKVIKKPSRSMTLRWRKILYFTDQEKNRRSVKFLTWGVGLCAVLCHLPNSCFAWSRYTHLVLYLCSTLLVILKAVFSGSKLAGTMMQQIAKILHNISPYDFL